jgi:hypothetical protein
MASWSIKDLKGKGFVQNENGTYQKIEKIPQTNSIEKSIREYNIPKSAIFISGNVPSSKNSRQLIGGSKPRSIESKLCIAYRKQNSVQYLDNAKKFLDATKHLKKPINVYMFFVRDSKRRFDYHNACQLVFDLMTDYSWIKDDNANEVLLTPPKFGQGFLVNKNMSGVYIWS